MLKQQHDVQSAVTYKNILIKLSLVASLCMALFGTVVGLQSGPAHAAINNSAYSEQVIRQVFGSYANQAIRVARCESTMNPNAYNSYSVGGSHATGLFQILYPSTWNGTSQAGKSPYDVRANAQAAYDLFRSDGYSWRQWSCKP